jgi:hypothetical protein
MGKKFKYQVWPIKSLVGLKGFKLYGFEFFHVWAQMHLRFFKLVFFGFFPIFQTFIV